MQVFKSISAEGASLSMNATSSLEIDFNPRLQRLITCFSLFHLGRCPRILHFAPLALILICSLFVVNSYVSNALALGIGRGGSNCAALAVGGDNYSPTDCYLAIFLAG